MVRKKSKQLKMSGILSVHPDGYGFVSTDLEKDVFIPRKYMNGAIHNDTVLISVKTHDGKSYEGKVLKIIQRNMKYIVGVVEREHNRWLCHPLDKHLNAILPFEKGTKGLNPGDVVQCEIIDDHKGNLSVKLFKKIGNKDTPDIELNIVIAKHNLPSKFSRLARTHAKNLRYEVSNSERIRRRDLTALPIVTIDNDDAKDFDDAVFVNKTDNGYTLFVSIADVSHYVKMDDPIDVDAFERGTSVYFPNKVLPMLPEELSNELCSLKPNEERLTISAEIQYDKNGNRSGYTIYPSIIRSSARLTYTYVKELLETRIHTSLKEKELLSNLQIMQELAMKLRSHRMDNGSLDLDLPDIELTLNQFGVPESISRKERNIAHIIIEEFMLEANRVVATFCTSPLHPFIYRIHEPPDNDKLFEFYLFVHNLGLKPPQFDELDTRALQRILDKVKDTKLERVINYALLRSMKQARYAVENTGHYGLAFDLYTHFTSPIRRYPDLTVHRIIKDKLTHTMNKQRSLMWASRLEGIAKHSSETERRAMDAERELYKMLTCKMLIDKQNIPLNGYISGITSSGLFIEIEDFFIDGFLAFEDIPGDYFYADNERHIAVGKRTKRTFKIGQQLRVQIVHINRFNGDIRLEPV
ncbi:MAG: ribonuclease R [bacterium]